MRKVTAGLFHSLDGVVEAPDQWQFDQFDEDLGAMLGAVLAQTDAVIIGRKGYEEWAGYWPKAAGDAGFADFINAVPKHVASRTLSPDQLDWQNSHLIAGELEAFVRELKTRDGKNIAVMASISMVRQLFLAGLLDELTLITHPVIAGAGKRHLFAPDDPTTRLELVESTRTTSGNVVSVYRLKA